jgi:hypothetical protein
MWWRIVSFMVALGSISVKILGTNGAVMCEVMNCERSADFLFRTGAGPISAFCGLHAVEAARKFGIALSNTSEGRSRYSWRPPDTST